MSDISSIFMLLMDSAGFVAWWATSNNLKKSGNNTLAIFAMLVCAGGAIGEIVKMI